MAEDKWQKAYRLNFPEKLNQAKREWRAKNKERLNAKQRAYRLANKEKLKAYKEKYKERYPHKAGEYRRQRRARELEAIAIPYKVEDVLEKYGTNCHICNELIDLTAPRKSGERNWERGLHIDHIIPISKGGSDTIDNVRPAHGQCNLSKGSKDWMIENGS